MKVISGGQTGADRTGLEVARDLGISTGGTVPRGWRTETGPDPSLRDFGCVQSASENYPPRTKANVQNSDGTVWFGRIGSRGYLATKREVDAAKKPYIENPSTLELVGWMNLWKIKTLNVAGNRLSENPYIVTQVQIFLGGALKGR